MASAEWYLARNDQKIGPFNSFQLKQLATVGMVGRTDMVCAVGANKWTEASSVPGLFPDSDQRKYWLQHSGRTRGPYVVDQLRAGLTTREWTLDAQIWTDDSGEMMSLAQLPEMSQYKPSSVSQSHAHLLTASLEIEEAALHMAGKKGDEIAKLMSSLLDLTRVHADKPTLVDSLKKSIEALRVKREKLLEQASQ